MADLTPVVVDEPAALEPHLAAWDRLAVECGRPFCSPDWMLSWWLHGRTGDARLRVVLAIDGDGDLIGIGPFFAQVTSSGPVALAEYRLLAAGFSHRIGLLARPGRETEVGSAVARALANADPPPASIVLEGIDAADRWGELLVSGWPGRAALRTDLMMDAPTIDLADGYEAWLGRRERKFRKEARRTARRLDELEVTTHLGDEAAALEALVDLHEARWRDRGGSNLDDRARSVIGEAARRLSGEPGRLTVVALNGPDGTIAAELVVRAGATMAFWAGGFDPEWSQHAPGTQAMLNALAAAPATVRVADLGGGAHEYKRRMADGSAPLAWRTVFPLGMRYPLIRLLLAPKHIRQLARARFRRLPAGVQQRTLRLLGRNR